MQKKETGAKNDQRPKNRAWKGFKLTNVTKIATRFKWWKRMPPKLKYYTHHWSLVNALLTTWSPFHFSSPISISPENVLLFCFLCNFKGSLIFSNIPTPLEYPLTRHTCRFFTLGHTDCVFGEVSSLENSFPFLNSSFKNSVPFLLFIHLLLPFSSFTPISHS